MSVLRTGVVTPFEDLDDGGSIRSFNAEIAADCDFVLIHWHHRLSTLFATGITVGGVAATEIDSRIASSITMGGSLWRLVAPPTGAAVEIVVTMDASGGGTAAIGAAVIPFKGVHQTTPNGIPNSGEGTSEKPTVTFDTVAGDYPFACYNKQRTGTLALDTPATELYAFDLPQGSTTTNAGHMQGATDSPGDPSTTISWAAETSTTDWVSFGVALKEAPVGPDPATISRDPANIAQGRQTDLAAHVRINTVDTAAGNVHALWVHTSDLGSDPATWEATATLVDADVTTNDLVFWNVGNADTTRHFRVISTPASGDKSISTNLVITTAYARPTSPTVISRTENTVTVSATDASGGVAPHRLFVRESTDPLSSLSLVTTIPANTSLEYEVPNLTSGIEYSFEYVAWDGEEDPALARYSGLVAVTATPGLLLSGMYTRIIRVNDIK